MSPSPTLRSSKRRPAKPEERPRRPGPGRPPKPVVEYPEPLWERVEAPRDFAAAFDAEIRRHGDSVWGLQKATTAKGGTVDRTTLGAWRRGTKGPQTPASLQVVDLIEDRYRLPQGYLRSRVTHGRAVSGHSLPDIGVAERRRLAWHLPDDFNARTAGEQAEILAWVRSSVLSGGTAYHRYHAEVSKHPRRDPMTDTRPGPRPGRRDLVPGNWLRARACSSRPRRRAVRPPGRHLRGRRVAFARRAAMWAPCTTAMC